MTIPKIIGIQLNLKSGKNIINLIEGTIVNNGQNVNDTFKNNNNAKSGKDIYMDKVRSLSIFADADLTMQFQGASVEFDMMSFYKMIKGIEVEEIILQIDNVFVPDSNRVIIVASDDPNFDFGVVQGKPHLYYSNSLTAIDSAWQTILYRHTILDKLKVKVFNKDGAAKDCSIDIQHKEMPPSDANDEWLSYDGYPRNLITGDVLIFGDDALRDTKHHFHQVLVKTLNVGETSPVKAVLFGV